MTKIYTDKSFDIKKFIIEHALLEEGHRYYRIFHCAFYLCLLSKDVKEDILSIFGGETKSAFNSILNIDQEFCRSIEECDYVLIPPDSVSDSKTDILIRWSPLIKEAKKAGKKIVVMLGMDDDVKFSIPPELGIVFRGSGFLSESEDNIKGLPTTNSDFYRGKLLPKELSIGFCGYLNSHPKRELLIKAFMQQFPEECNFILNPGWCGDGLIEKRKEFFKNLHNNLYCLCARGGGNFSARLGEILMMGRIPIFFDTDCILPFRESIPYETNFIVITEDNLPHVKEIVTDFHERHSEEDLIRIQKENRSLWEKYFTPEGIFNQIISML